MPHHRCPRLSTRRLLTAALLAAPLAWSPAALGQTTRTVTSNLDDNSGGTLREVIAASASGDTINFDAGVSGQTITLGSTLILDRGLAINGAGQGITLSGAGTQRIFLVTAGSDTVALNGLTLANGQATGGAGGTGSEGGGGGALGAGGAIFAGSGDLRLTDVALVNNAAVGGAGGNGAGGGTGSGGGGLGGDGVSGGAGGAGLPGVTGTGGSGGSTSTGGAGGFGGGGGGGGFNGSSGSSGGAGGFGGGAGGSGGFTSGSAASPGLGGGAGENRSGTGGGGAGGGGAGLGGAVFIAEGVTLTVESTAANASSGNAVTSGAGGTGGSSGASAGSQFFAQGTSQTLTFNVANNVTQSLDVSGFADETALNGGTNSAALTKTGAGTLTLTGTSAFRGDLTANAGRLNVNALLTSNALVQAGGTLGGNGTVVNLTNTGGTVAPGNSIDTLEVTGDFTQDAAGTLEIEFDATDIDELDITGDANLAGTVSFVELATGSAADAAPRTFLTAENIIGSFDTTTTVFATGSTLGSATLNLDTSGARDTLGVVFSDFVAAFEDQALTQTGAAAGSALDQLAVDDAAASVPLINALNASASVPNALESQGNTVANAAGFQGHAAQQLVADTARARVWGLSGRTLVRHAAERQAAAERAAATQWFTIAEGLETAVDAAAASADAEPVTFATPAPRAADGDGPSLWAQALGRFGDIDGDGTSLGFDAATYGISLGAEWADAPRDAVVGLFIGFTESEVEIDNLNDDADIENLQFGLYGSKRIDDRWSLNGSASISTLTFDTARATAAGTADGEFDALGLYGAIEALYDWKRNDRHVISPFVSVEVSYLDRDAYSESGAGALNLTAQGSDDTFLTSVVGVQVSADYVLDNGWRFTPAARVGWALQHLDDASTTTSAFAAGSPFATTGPERSENAVRLGVSLDLTPGESNRWSVFTRYTGDLTDNAQDHIVQAGVRFAF